MQFVQRVHFNRVGAGGQHIDGNLEQRLGRCRRQPDDLAGVLVFLENHQNILRKVLPARSQSDTVTDPHVGEAETILK